MKTKVIFVYCEASQSWEILIEGITNNTKVLQTFNAIILICRYAIRRMDHSKIKLQSDGSYKINIGI